MTTHKFTVSSSAPLQNRSFLFVQNSDISHCFPEIMVIKGYYLLSDNKFYHMRSLQVEIINMSQLRSHLSHKLFQSHCQPHIAYDFQLSGHECIRWLEISFEHLDKILAVHAHGTPSIPTRGRSFSQLARAILKIKVPRSSL